MAKKKAISKTPKATQSKKSSPKIAPHARISSSALSYDTQMIIVVLLLIFIYPAGIILMWVWMKWPLWVKLLVMLPLLLGILLFAFVVMVLSVAIHHSGDFERMRIQQYQQQPTVTVTPVPTYAIPKY